MVKLFDEVRMTCQFTGGATRGPMCGKKTLPGKPYCQEHYDICHVKTKPPSTFKRRDGYKSYVYGSGS